MYVVIYVKQKPYFQENIKVNPKFQMDTSNFHVYNKFFIWMISSAANVDSLVYSKLNDTKVSVTLKTLNVLVHHT